MSVVPLHLVPEPGETDQFLPYVDVAIGGATSRLLLDSGAARTTAVPPSGARLRSGVAESTGAFGIPSGEDRRQWTTTVRVGDHTIDQVDLDIRTDAAGSDLLGQDVLARFRCEYRFGDRELRLNPASRPMDAHRIHLGEGGHVYLDLNWPTEGAAASAVFDTGASVTVVNTAFAEAHPDLFAPIGTSQGTDSSGATFETPMVDMVGPHILGRVFTSTTAALVDLEPANRTAQCRMDMIIGWPILCQANWLIDHPGKLAVLTD